MRQKRLIKPSCIVLIGLAMGCSNPVNDSNGPERKKLDIAKIEDVLGIKGTQKDGEYKVTVPQNDLSVFVDSFKIIPPMGLGSWAAFTPTADGAMIMGDIVVTETDLKYVQEEVIRQDLTVTAIHNHFVRDKPHVMYMHIGGMGPEEELARGVKAVFDKVTEVRGKVAPVIKALVENGIEVVAVHNHMVHEEPRIFFLHYWGVGPAEKLVRGLKAALDQTGKATDGEKAAASIFPGFTEVLCAN